MSQSLLKLLGLLSDGQFHSGSVIAEVLGVSRTAVWKHLKKLSAMGLSAESVKGKGYRLLGGLELLDGEYIARNLDDVVVGQLDRVDVLLETESTNSVAMSYSLSESAKGYACLAEYQHAGRGRRGRQWESPFGHNIYLSLAWQFDGGAAQLEGLSLAVGVVVAKVLGDSGVEGIQLKWPNDILLQGRKLGGVLLEMSGDPSGQCQVVIGIGVNVRMPQSVSIDQPWASIAEQLPDISKNQIVIGLLNSLVDMLSKFDRQGFLVYRDAWQMLDAYKGESVIVSSGQHTVEGKSLGVLDNGALRLQVAGEECVVYGGEVSLRLVNAS